MDFILLKSNSRLEYRLYLEKPEDDKLGIFYTGHKLGINDTILDECLSYRFESSTNRIFYLKYDVWIKKYDSQYPSNLMLDIWRPGNIESKSKDLYETWSQLLKLITSEKGNFRNIWIVKINI